MSLGSPWDFMKFIKLFVFHRTVLIHLVHHAYIISHLNLLLMFIYQDMTCAILYDNPCFVNDVLKL